MNALEALTIRIATDPDSAAMLKLLSDAKLPTGDLGDGLPGVFLAADAWCSHGLGDRLVNECEAMAQSAALTQPILLTTTAADYFLKRGYTEIARDSVPAAVADLAQFRSLFPDSAWCLGKKLAG